MINQCGVTLVFTAFSNYMDKTRNMLGEMK